MRKTLFPGRALIGWQPQLSRAGALQASAASTAGCLRHWPQLGSLHPSQAKLSSRSSQLYTRWNGTGGCAHSLPRGSASAHPYPGAWAGHNGTSVCSEEARVGWQASNLGESMSQGWRGG